jgi:hypothetical protein
VLSPEQKVVLGVQLYDIIARSDKSAEQMPAFYGFMDRLGMAAQAIEIVHQLQTGERTDADVAQTGELPLEVLTFGRDAQADVWLKSLRPGERLIAFRYRATARARCFFADLHRPARDPRRTGAHLRGHHLLFQREEGRLPHARLSGDQRQR